MKKSRDEEEAFGRTRATVYLLVNKASDAE